MFYFDPEEADFKAKITNLQPTPGYCIVVDISGSTKLKDESIGRWASFIHNTFVNTRVFMPSGVTPLKSLGDALMFFVPENELSASGYRPLHLYDALHSIVSERDPLFREVKASACYCERGAFELTFLRNVPDVYGKDIDLTFRLLGFAKARQIVMNKGFVTKVRSDYDSTGNQAQFSAVLKIDGPTYKRAKGFSSSVATYRYSARADV